MIVLGIDPGEKQSGYVRWECDLEKILSKGVLPNDKLLDLIIDSAPSEIVAVEVIRGYGQRSGNETFITCQWAGRFIEAAISAAHKVCFEVPRKTKQGSVYHLCGNDSAGDSGVKRALEERFGDPGKNRAPGLLFGVTGHMRAALAVAITIGDKVCQKI